MILLLAITALAATTLALPTLAAPPLDLPPESDDLWARVGGLEAWYFENAYTDSPPPADTSTSAEVNTRVASDPPTIHSLVSSTLTATTYLPLVAQDYPSGEFRGVWVSRFDWTGFGITPTTSTLDAIVANIKTANFNAILFQVRGTADAYYTPGREPWAARLTGQLTKTLGVSPGWDPLAYLVTRAHAQGIQVHAYINVFPNWLCGLGAPPDPVTPRHLFWSLTYSTAEDAWPIWTTSGPQSYATCSDYLWATPALSLTRAHVAAVAADLTTRYDIDGIHLDLVRYPGSNTSHDPFTRRAYTAALALSPTLTFAGWQPGFQRAQISHLVSQVYSAVVAVKPEAWVSAAVWPNYTSGYNAYFQDSKGWLASGRIDANMPMLYASDIVTNLAAWTTRMQSFVADSHGRYVLPGIHADYADFADIVARIEAARAAGAPGVAIFSYGALNTRGYFDDLGAGPFALPAQVPTPEWKP
ncbi:MAG TPA: family 10 glycosylhydrolase [Anaerolineae bacterium]|nr:family 10 glycosylhydrolase [Anaerolineae bacterium]